MQESGLKIATIVGMKAEINSNFKVLGAGCYFFSGVDYNLTIALAVGGIYLALAAGSLILNIVKIAVKKKQTANVRQILCRKIMPKNGLPVFMRCGRNIAEEIGSFWADIRKTAPMQVCRVVC